MKAYPVIDFHTHVLPRMDDGSASSDMSLQMLHQMKKTGTDVVIATSHYYRQRESIASFLQRREASSQRLFQKTDAACPELRLGAEVAFYFGIEKDEELGSLCIEGTNALLVEMPFTPWTDYEVNGLSALCNDRQFRVILAHFERFTGCMTAGMRERLLSLPLMVQLNGEAFLSLLHRSPWLDMLKQEQAHLLGSDSHNLKNRAPNLEQARRVIEKKLGTEALERIDRCGASVLSFS